MCTIETFRRPEAPRERNVEAGSENSKQRAVRGRRGCASEIARSVMVMLEKAGAPQPNRASARASLSMSTPPKVRLSEEAKEFTPCI